jgi:hypothetical protein
MIYIVKNNSKKLLFLNIYNGRKYIPILATNPQGKVWKSLQKSYELNVIGFANDPSQQGVSKFSL